MLLFASTLATTLMTAQAATPPACESVKKTQIDRAADLPKGALEAFGASMADKGQPFQSTDVGDAPPRPLYRFKSAEQDGCRLVLDYENGRRNNRIETATFVADGTGWQLIGRKFKGLP